MTTPSITCGCPIARHKHGTVPMYDAPHKCRCASCREAKADYTARDRGFQPLVSALPSRKRLRELHAAGMTTLDVATASGLSPATLYALNGPNPHRRRKMISSKTERAVLSVGHQQLVAVERSAQSRVDPTTSADQLKVLHCLGWTNEEVSARGSLRLDTLYRLLRGFTTTVAVARQIDETYQLLRNQEPPQGTELERARVRRAKRKAEENGWDVFLVA